MPGNEDELLFLIWKPQRKKACCLTLSGAALGQRTWEEEAGWGHRRASNGEDIRENLELRNLHPRGKQRERFEHFPEGQT